MSISETYNTNNLPEMKKFPDLFFDWAVIDPQYGINATKMNMGANQNKNRSSCEWDNEPPPQEYWKELFRISQNQIICGANYFPLPPSRGIVFWDKLQPWSNFSQFELIWTSTDKPAKMYRISSRGGANKIEKFHPTEKPIELYEKLYFDFVKKGSKILDTHLGTGNNRIVAHRWGCDFWGYEIDKVYFDKSNERFDNYLAEKKRNPELFKPVLQTLNL